jgi:hypothetical protein
VGRRRRAGRGAVRAAGGAARTGLLAVGLLHASFNATGSLGAWVGGWQQIPATVVLALIVAAARRLSR